MKFSKMLLLTFLIGAVGLAVVNAIYWILLCTTPGKYILVILFIGVWYGIAKIFTLGKPKEKIW